MNNKLMRLALEMTTRKLESQLNGLRHEFAKAAQKVYDDWDEDPDEYAGGGICHLIADEIGRVASAHGYDFVPMDHPFEQHVWTLVYSGDPNNKTPDGQFIDFDAVHVDIPPRVYERGAGYSWEKIPGVRFRTTDIQIYEADLKDVADLCE